MVAELVFTIAQRAALAYLLIAALDFALAAHGHEKSLRMSKEELKQEFKQQALPAEIKAVRSAAGRWRCPGAA